MVFAGIVGSDVGIRPFGYITAMVVIIGLWLTLAQSRVTQGPVSGDQSTFPLRDAAA